MLNEVWVKIQPYAVTAIQWLIQSGILAAVLIWIAKHVKSKYDINSNINNILDNYIAKYGNKAIAIDIKGITEKGLKDINRKLSDTLEGTTEAQNEKIDKMLSVVMRVAQMLAAAPTSEEKAKLLSDIETVTGKVQANVAEPIYITLNDGDNETQEGEKQNGIVF